MGDFLNAFGRLMGNRPATSNDIQNLGDAIRQQAGAAGRASQNVSQMRAELSELTLIVAATLKTLIDKGLVTPGDIVARLGPADLADGIADGRVTAAGLRALLGVSEPPAPASPAKPVRRSASTRYRDKLSEGNL